MFDKSVKKLLRLTIPMFALMVVLSVAPGNKTYAAEDASTSDSEIVTVAAEDEGSIELASDTTEETEATDENADVEVASETTTVAASTADFDSMGVFMFLIGIGVGAIAIVSFREYMIEK